MTEHLRIRVYGDPAPQGSKTKMPNGALLEAGSATGRARHRAWRHAVTSLARAAWDDRPPIDGPVAVLITFRIERPKSRRNDVWHTGRRDLDKLARSVLDSLTKARVLVDDSRVAQLNAEKLYASTEPEWAWTGADIVVTELAIR